MRVTDANEYGAKESDSSDSFDEDMSYSKNTCLGSGFEVQLESSESELGCEQYIDHKDIRMS